MNAFLRCSLLLAVMLTWGCGREMLVDTPNLYVHSDMDPFADVPAALQGSDITVIYGTDRVNESKDGAIEYGARRGESLAFGTCVVTVGEQTTWQELVTASRTDQRKPQLPLELTAINEVGHYPPLAPLVEINGQWVEDPVTVEATSAAITQLHELLAERLALTPRKEVCIFVHGYNNNFETAAFRIAQVWHFMGRVGVPIVYSWPAGSGGLLRGYTQDRESGEFTCSHLKQFLRDIAACPDVQKVHLVAHSRGTDVLVNVLREIHVEYRGAGRSTREAMKLGHLVLVAPDIDLDVFVQRAGAERLAFVPERFTLYSSPNDRALGLADFLFRSKTRLGQLDLRNEPRFADFMERHPVMSVISVSAKTDFMGHGYFTSSPAVLSDLILLMLYGDGPGAENGRPLIDGPGGYWELPDGYPFHDQDQRSK